MSLEHDLERAYACYLTKPREGAVLLASLLTEAGLPNEGEALRTFLAQGPGQVVALSSESHGWFASPDLPPHPRAGDIWFDVVEMAAMAFVPAPAGWSPDLEGWVRLRPVPVWQFRAFAQLATLGAPQLQLPVPEDFLAPARFADRPAFEPVTALYLEEAVAYARWFGKFLCGQDDLYAAREFLPAEAFASALPQGLKLWDEREHPESQSKRVAFGRETLERDPFALKGEQMVFEEWERSPSIGFSTLAASAGLLTEIPRRTQYFAMENGALRNF